VAHGGLGSFKNRRARAEEDGCIRSGQVVPLTSLLKIRVPVANRAIYPRGADASSQSQVGIGIPLKGRGNVEAQRDLISV